MRAAKNARFESKAAEAQKERLEERESGSVSETCNMHVRVSYQQGQLVSEVKRATPVPQPQQNIRGGDDISQQFKASSTLMKRQWLPIGKHCGITAHKRLQLR